MKFSLGETIKILINKFEGILKTSKSLKVTKSVADQSKKVRSAGVREQGCELRLLYQIILHGAGIKNNICVSQSWRLESSQLRLLIHFLICRALSYCTLTQQTQKGIFTHLCLERH